MKIAAVCSLLHESADSHSAARLFRGEPVLAWTLARLERSRFIQDLAVLCWEDQFPQIEPIAADLEVYCSVRHGRGSLPDLNALSAAGRWADGWRGGLLGCCAFDKGFVGPWMLEIQKELAADALLLVDPSSGLVDAGLIDGLIEHAEKNPQLEFFFSQAAPGLSGALIRAPLLGQLAAGHLHPGAVLTYRPELALPEPIAGPACAPIPTALARTTLRFTLDSSRQIDRITQATEHLNGELISTASEQLLQTLNAQTTASPLPREIVLEVNRRRIATPIYSPIQVAACDGEMSLDLAGEIFAQLAEADDLRLILGGVGDPLLHSQAIELIESAHNAGINAIAIETDLLGLSPERIDQLADSPADIISVFLPAMTAQTYHAVMGVDGFAEVIGNLRRLLQRRSRGVPLLVPTFVKTRRNLPEMEAWYDHWLKTLACAVILGPSDYVGQITDVSVAAMEPPRRRPCGRLNHRMTILLDGRIVSCEQDIGGQQILGRIPHDSVEEIWTGGMASLRQDHAEGNWQRHPLCANCREWHRP
ncbi:MAG: radical SAM protein [Tepidisphaeraceae bacterium]|jgi:radical SAM protein with 4Fe4S-binding SPASM domain